MHICYASSDAGYLSMYQTFSLFLLLYPKLEFQHHQQFSSNLQITNSALHIPSPLQETPAKHPLQQKPWHLTHTKKDTPTPKPYLLSVIKM